MSQRGLALTPSVFLLSCLLTLFAACPVSAQPDMVAQSGQAALVLADSWNSRAGVMRLYERSPGGPWRQAGAPIRVILGKNGLGWGRGLHDTPGGGAEGITLKREGDGKAPAGIFRLGPAFGYAPAESRRLKIDYMQMTAAFECVDDPASPRYNQVLDASALPARDWNSSERMRRDDGLYEIGVVVAHNMPSTVPGAGSCIFLHVWPKPDGYTSGCTAMAFGDMERVAAWLDPAKSPVLVQLPESEHGKFRKLYGVP